MKKPANMKEFTAFMHNLSGALMLFGQTMISAFFVIVILSLVLVVEIQRVAHGIALFEVSEQSAYLGAFVLVMMLLTLEFVIHYVETKQGYHQEQKKQFSLRLFARWMKYFIGASDDWSERLKSPAQAIKSYSRLLTITILALALGGSMADTISAVDGNWMQGMRAIALDSSLLEIVRWSGGLLFALALVIGAQRLTAYVAQRASETLAGSNGGKHDYKHDFGTQGQELAIVSIEPELEFMPFMPDEKHEVSCDVCDWKGSGYKSGRRAELALQAHKRHCELPMSLSQLEIAE